jgi:prepilin-type N-terminal cleavage/methylation domain-containing protein
VSLCSSIGQKNAIFIPEMDRTRPIRNGASGFSLIELLIVVAIILIIAAIAIPNLLRARIAANESSAAASVRSIATAEFSYNSAYPTLGYAAALSNLGGPAAGCSPSSATACIIDNALSNGSKSGYAFAATGFAQAGAINVTFVGGSAPLAFNQSGVRNFCIVTDGVLRSNPGVSGGVPAPDVPSCQAYAIAQ